jgi:hypothetical protein
MMQKNTKDPIDKHSSAENHAAPSDEKKGGVKAKTKVRAWLWWMCLAGLLLFLAQYVEGFHHTLIIPSLLIASLGSLASAIAFWIQYTNNNGRHIDGYIRASLILFLGLAICAGLYWWNHRHTQPKTHVKLSLHVQGSATVALTNDCLFRADMVNVIHRTNNFLFFNGIATGCVVVPVSPRESNKVIALIAENDSPAKIDDLTLMIGLPDATDIALDHSKWHEAGAHWFIPGWKLQITNIHFWAAQSPWSLYPSDTVEFPPITNSSIPVSNNPANTNSLLYIYLRSSGFEQVMSANVLFLHVPSNQTFNPFITTMQKDTNGTWHISPSREELNAATNAL